MITMTINKKTIWPTTFREGHCRISNPRNWLRLKLVQLVVILSPGDWATITRDKNGNLIFTEPKNRAEKEADRLRYVEINKELMADSTWYQWYKKKQEAKNVA